MRLTRNNNQPSQPNQTADVPLAQRRLKTKPTLTLIAVLFLANILWFFLWLLPLGDKESQSDSEIVASIGKVDITKQQWMSQMETLYGEETLQDMVNLEVMEQAAKKNNIEVTEEEIDLEVKLLRSAQDINDSTITDLSDKQLRDKLRAQIILQKVLAEEIVIDDADAATYYEENKSFYNIETAYRTSILVVASEDEANAALKEIQKGSDFTVLARERSLHATSASLGGDIGYITEHQEGIDANITKAASELKTGELSKPVKLSDGHYAIVTVLDVLEGQSFKFKEVQSHIKRELAIEQLAGTVTPEMFWSEFDASWLYGDGK